MIRSKNRKTKMPSKKTRTPSNFIDLTGKRFGRLLVQCRASPRRKKDKPRWACLCDCGTVLETQASQLRRGQTKSCGCLQVERTKEVNTTHGKKGTRVYRIWSNMLTRCRNPRSKDYAQYGKRGIHVCQEWYSFESFYEDMGEPPTVSHEIERVDNSLGYKPGNCVWATDTQQSRNRRSNVLLTWCGKTQCISAWEQELGFKAGRLSRRLRSGWDLKRAIETPINHNLSRY